MAGRAGAKRRISFNQKDGSEAEAWTWILETEQLIEEMKAARVIRASTGCGACWGRPWSGSGDYSASLAGDFTDGVAQRSM